MPVVNSLQVVPDIWHVVESGHLRFRSARQHLARPHDATRCHSMPWQLRLTTRICWRVNLKRHQMKTSRMKLWALTRFRTLARTTRTRVPLWALHSNGNARDERLLCEGQVGGNPFSPFCNADRARFWRVRAPSERSANLSLSGPRRPGHSLRAGPLLRAVRAHCARAHCFQSITLLYCRRVDRSQGAASPFEARRVAVNSWRNRRSPWDAI